jgi:predicted O-methyltransferase YrrM
LTPIGGIGQDLGTVRAIRRRLARVLTRAFERLEFTSRRDEDIVLSALMTPTLVAQLHDPVRFVSFVRGCLGRVSCRVVPVQQREAPPSLREFANRFSALLDTFRDVPALTPATALRLGHVADTLRASRQPTDGAQWAADDGILFDLCSTPPEKGRVLATIVRLMRSHRSVEIGTAYGLSALFTLTEQAISELHTIEINESLHTQAAAWLRTYHPDRAVCHLGSSHNVLPRLGLKEASVDFLFHDGYHSHASYVRDFGLALPLLSPGAVVVFDDIRWEEPRFTEGQPAHTYAGWRAVVDHSRVIHAVEIDGGLGLALLGE